MNIFSVIKTHIQILDVVQEYTTLKKAGNYWKGQCPFHHERTASFTVSPHKEIFYCFGCHNGGDVVTFIAKAENCTPVEAVKHLAERYAIQLPEDTLQQFTAHKHEKEIYAHVHETVANWCAEQFKKSKAAQEYLKKRGITQTSIDNFLIGYFPGGQQNIKKLLAICKDSNIMAQDLIQANVLREGQTGLYSPYEERVTFPINDALGRACGLGGRIFTPHDTRAKYYNSQDHPYFSKGTILYGFHQAKKHIQETGAVYLVEGYLDCIAFAQAGIPQTVATLGTACTAEHIKNLSRYAEKLYTVYDGDSAGQKAALRLTQLCWDVNIEPYIIPLPEKEDPASLVSAGKTANYFTEKAQDIFEFFVKQQTASPRAELSLPEHMARIGSIIELISSIKDTVKQDILLNMAADRCGIPAVNLKRHFLEKKALHTRKNNIFQPEVIKQAIMYHQATLLQVDLAPFDPAVAKAMAGRRAFSAERQFEASDARDTAETAQVNTQIEISDLEKKIFSAIISKKYILTPEQHFLLKLAFTPYLLPIIERLQAHKELQTVTITELCDEREKEFIVSVLMEDEVRGKGPELEELIKQFCKKQWKMIVDSVKIKIAQAQKLNRNNELESIIAQFQNLKQKLFMKDQV